VPLRKVRRRVGGVANDADVDFGKSFSLPRKGKAGLPRLFLVSATPMI
jgi:hypothetical protein